jgi:hypothetical protein
MKTITAEELDKKFDDGEDISDYLDLKNAYRPSDELKRVNVDFPLWMVTRLDRAFGCHAAIVDKNVDCGKGEVSD